MEEPTGPPGEAPQKTWGETMRISHPAWGVALGLLIVLADVRFAATDRGLTAGGKLLLFLALAAFILTVLWTFGVAVRRPIVVAAPLLVAAIIAAVVSGDWFNGASEAPRWRDAVIPTFDLAVLATGSAAWYLGRGAGAEVLLVAGVTATGMITYGQQEAFVWAAIVAVAATFLFLLPQVGTFGRITGVVVHALALLGFIQLRPAWFEWAVFPFLLLFPVYLLATYFRETGRARRFAWWTGAALAGAIFLLGTSTLIGNLRNGASVADSVFMQALGASLGVAFYLLRWQERRSAPIPVTGEA